MNSRGLEPEDYPEDLEDQFLRAHPVEVGGWTDLEWEAIRLADAENPRTLFEEVQ